MSNDELAQSLPQRKATGRRAELGNEKVERSSTVVNVSVGYRSAYGYGCVAGDVAYGAVEIVACRE